MRGSTTDGPIFAGPGAPTSVFGIHYPTRLLGIRMHKFSIQQIQPHCRQIHEGHYFFLAPTPAAAIAWAKSSSVLESVNSSEFVIFRLPSSSVMMSTMKIDS